MIIKSEKSHNLKKTFSIIGILKPKSFMRNVAWSLRKTPQMLIGDNTQKAALKKPFKDNKRKFYNVEFRKRRESDN